MSSALVFLIMFTFFALLLIGAGWVTKRWVNDSDDFILAGREVSATINVFGMLAIGYAGTSIALYPSLAISFGFWGSMTFGLLYSVVGFGTYGLLVGGYFRRCGAQTMPEWLEMRYGTGVRILVTFGAILGLCGIMANNVVSLAATITGYAGWPLWVSVTACFGVIVAFAFFSGLWAVTLTDFIQMIFGIIAMPLFVIMLGKTFGFDFLAAKWPVAASMWTHGFTGQSMPIFTLKYPSVLTLAILFGFFLVWGNNYYYLRLVSCRTEKVAKQSYLIAGVLLVIIVNIPLAIIGLYAAAAHPNVWAPVGKMPGVAAYGYMMGTFGAALASFLLVGALAASISTAATALIGANATATRDIYKRLIKPEATSKELLAPSRIILLILGALTWLLTFYPGGPVYLFAFANAWMGPPAVLVVLGVFWRRFSPQGALWGVIAGMSLMGVLTFTELMKIYSISPIMHVGVAGLIATVTVGVAVSIITRPRYYGETDWQRDPKNGSREVVKLDEFDLKVLDLLRFGHDHMVEITDYLTTDSRHTNASIENLDRGGYLMRKALTGENFMAFEITEKGIAALPVISGQEAEMAKYGLRSLYIQFMEAAQVSQENLAKFTKEKGLGSLTAAAIISSLTRKNYITQNGVWRRIINVTPKGEEMLKKFSSGKGLTAKGTTNNPTMGDTLNV